MNGCCYLKLKLWSNRLIEIVICNYYWKLRITFLFVTYKNNIETSVSGFRGSRRGQFYQEECELRAKLLEFPFATSKDVTQYEFETQASMQTACVLFTSRGLIFISKSTWRWRRKKYVGKSHCQSAARAYCSRHCDRDNATRTMDWTRGVIIIWSWLIPRAGTFENPEKRGQKYG